MADVTGRKSKFGVLFLAFLVLAFGGAAGYLYYQYSLSQKELTKLKDPKYISELQDQQVLATLDKLGAIMLLPEENPTVATIIDADALRTENDAFYKNAQNGDKLVIYTQQAILFREEENKVINVAPVFIEPNQGQEDTTKNEDNKNVTKKESVGEDLEETDDYETGL